MIFSQYGFTIVIFGNSDAASDGPDGILQITTRRFIRSIITNLWNYTVVVSIASLTI